MKIKPILIVAGEPYSIFSEIFFKSISRNKYKNPLILIASSKIFLKQMSNLKFKLPINLVSIKNTDFNKLDNKKINIIDVNFVFKKGLRYLIS